jgi:hypothetical protein
LLSTSANDAYKNLPKWQIRREGNTNVSDTY